MSIARESHLLDQEDTQQPKQPRQMKRVLMYTFNNECPPGIYHKPNSAQTTPLVPLKRQPDRIDLIKAALTDQAASVEELWLGVNRRFEFMEASQTKMTELVTRLEYENSLLNDKLTSLEQPLQNAHQELKDECAKTIKNIDFTCQIGTHLARRGIRNEYETVESKLNGLIGSKVVDDLAQSLEEVSVQVKKAARDSEECKTDVERNYDVVAKLMSSLDSYVVAHDRHERRRDKELSQIRVMNARLEEQVKELRQQVGTLLQTSEIEREQAVEILK